MHGAKPYARSADALPNRTPQKQDNAEAALVGIVAAGVTDWADGYFARQMKTSSILGSYLDPLADKARSVWGRLRLCCTWQGMVAVQGVSCVE